MVLLLNSAASECSVSYLYRPRASFKVMCRHYAIRSHSAMMRIGIRMDEFGKCRARITLPKEIKVKRPYLPQLHPLVSAFPLFGRCPSSGGACILQEKSRAVSGKTFTFLSKLLFWGFAAVITGDKFVRMPQLCWILWTRPSRGLLSPMEVQKRTAVGVWQYRGLTSTPLLSKAAVAIYRKKNE